MSQHVVLTGGSGMVGREVLGLLSERESSVHVLARRPAPEGLRLRGAMSWVCADLTNARTVAMLPDRCDVVLHVAGEMKPDLVGNRAIQCDPTRRLLDRARQSGARRFVYVSSVAVYGDGRQVLTEEDAPRATESAYGISKREAEDLIFAAHDPPRFTTCVIRPCPILGSGPGHFAAGVRALVRQPTVPLPNAGRERVDLVDVADVARSIVDLAFLRPDASGAFNIVAGDALELGEILREAAEAIGARPHWQECSLDEAYAANAQAAARGEAPPIPPALIVFASVERTYSIARARDELAFSPRNARSALVDRVRRA
jgi:nucleoside-diphosphate-sugar epimerase